MPGRSYARAATRSGASALNFLRSLKSFTARFALVLAAGIVAAVVFAPLAARAVAAAGWRFPFPRIFDRTVMATLLIAILFTARDLELASLLIKGFVHYPGRSIRRALRGFVVAMCAIAALLAVAAAVGGTIGNMGALPELIPKYLLSAIAIAFIEEAFFRAIVLGGMRTDFGNRIALVASAAIYSLAHLVRSPARFYVTGYQPTAGLITLAHSIDQFTNPTVAIPTLIGLFLLGLVLGEAYILTGSVYLSIGLHGGFVLGAKLWPKIILNRASIPWWIAGAGSTPLIGGAAAWLIAIVVFAMLRAIADPQKRAAKCSNRTATGCRGRGGCGSGDGSRAIAQDICGPSLRWPFDSARCSPARRLRGRRCAAAEFLRRFRSRD
jgi:membrane protease YdiL (CAAX protease family)